MSHWCKNIERDEAVRAAEDNRHARLPTLEEAIAMLAKIGSASSAPEHENKGNDMATKAEIQRAEYRAEASEQPAPAPPAASGAAGTEPVAWGVRLKQSMEVPPGCASPRRVCRKTFTQFYFTQEEAAQRSGGTVVPLYAAPQPAPGWLTPNERLAISGAILILDQHGQTNIGRTLDALLARSTPPEVVAPASYAVEHPQPPRDLEWRKALAAAGVTVKEVK